ncbi:MAG: hypothetical protein QXR88_01645 [Candidatus Pacearchaeota archaeon]
MREALRFNKLGSLPRFIFLKEQIEDFEDLEISKELKVKFLVSLDFFQNMELNLFEGKINYDEDLSKFFALNRPKILHPYMVLAKIDNLDMTKNRICYDFEVFRIIFTYHDKPERVLPISPGDLKNKTIDPKYLESREAFNKWKNLMKQKYGRVPFRNYLLYNISDKKILSFEEFYDDLLLNLEPR